MEQLQSPQEILYKTEFLKRILNKDKGARDNYLKACQFDKNLKPKENDELFGVKPD